MSSTPKIPSNAVYWQDDAVFVGKMPLRTEITVLEADDIHFLRIGLRHLLEAGFTNTEITSIYNDLKKKLLLKKL